MPQLLDPNSPQAELQEVLKASQDEDKLCVLHPVIVLRLQVIHQAGICSWVRGGYFIWILDLKGTENKRNCLNTGQIFCSGELLWPVGRCSNWGEGADWGHLPWLAQIGGGASPLSPQSLGPAHSS